MHGNQAGCEAYRETDTHCNRVHAVGDSQVALQNRRFPQPLGCPARKTRVKSSPHGHATQVNQQHQLVHRGADIRTEAGKWQDTCRKKNDKIGDAITHDEYDQRCQHHGAQPKIRDAVCVQGPDFDRDIYKQYCAIGKKRGAIVNHRTR